jgi:ElaA protein
MTIEWVVKAFDALDVHELYAILRLRNEVFVVEQNCPYQDADNKDQASFHLCGWGNGQLLAYVRLLPPGLSYTEASIGRVVTAPAARGCGAGRQLMIVAIHELEKLYGKVPIQIGAQLYLKNFYQSLGFFPCGEMYLEDGIEHIHMLRKATDSQ